MRGLSKIGQLFLIGLALSFVGCNVKAQQSDHTPEEGYVSQVELINELRTLMFNEASAHPQIYDRADLQRFLQDPDGSYASKFLNQRSNHLNRAYLLACKTLRWRHMIDINNLDASHFPCDLFELGLIFESGVAHHQGPTGEYVQGSPIIWIRLGALGAVIQGHNEKFSAKRVFSSVYHSVRTFGEKTRTATRRTFNQHMVSQPPSSSAPLVESMSVKDDRTMNHITKAIAWWLEDWRKRHGPDAKATLVLDFENTDFAFSSWTMGEFFIQLDDYFPDMFDQIIGFRYKPRMWSLHSTISMFNRIFKSRIETPAETDRKLRFVSTEVQISTYMPRVDIKGYTMLPDHVSGNCVGPVHRGPPGCQADLAGLASRGIIDPQLWQAIHNEFFQICKPLVRHQ